MTHVGVDDVSVYQHPLVFHFLKGVYKSRPLLQDIPIHGMLLMFLHTSLVSKTTLNFLSKCLHTLMALSNADRCLELAAIDRPQL